MIWRASYIHIHSDIINNNNINSYIPTPNFGNISFTKNNVQNSGNDFRYNNTEPDFDPVIYQKYGLMESLKNHDSTLKKMELLHINKYLFNISMVYNITAGGLYDDYNFDFF